MRLTRPLFLQTAMLSIFYEKRPLETKTSSTSNVSSASSVLNVETSQCDSTDFSSTSSSLSLPVYHKPPAGVNYSQNPSVFGRILECTLPSTSYAESDVLYAFRDIRPRARLHALVIPKRFVPTVKCLLTACSCCPGTSDTIDLNRASTLSSKRSVDTLSTSDSYVGQSLDQRVALVLDMKQMALSIIHKEEPEAYQKGDYILCFHVPPFNSVDHLHLHVLAPASQMNMAYRYGKYLCGTPWCLEIDELIRRLENRMKEESSSSPCREDID